MKLKFALTAAACSAAALAAQARELPNVVLILCDDMGYGDVSSFNPASKIETRNIDRIVQNGARFTDAHSVSSLSTPSRYGLLTGRYPWRTKLKNGVSNGFSPALVEPGRTTLGSLLQRAGYHTACIGKWHLGWHWDNIEQGEKAVRYDRPVSEGPTTRGFDYFFGLPASLDMVPYVYVENDRPTMVPDSITPGSDVSMTLCRPGLVARDFHHHLVLPELTTRAVNYIHEQARGKDPFFLYLPLPAPHTPVLPAPEYVGKSGLNAYGDFVLMVDDQIGRVLAALDECGVSDDTIVIFATDNGCAPAVSPDELERMGHMVSYIWRGYKSDIFDGGHRIPLAVRWPARIRPHDVEQTVSLTDFLATLAAVTGQELAPNEGEDSFDLTPALFDAAYDEPLREATVHASGEGVLSIRKGPWKLIMGPSSGGWSHPTSRETREKEYYLTCQLYNLDTDPSERLNLYGTCPEVEKELTDLLTAYVRNGRSTPGPVQQNVGEWWPQLTWLPRP